jgi:hypothetical protein
VIHLWMKYKDGRWTFARSLKPEENGSLKIERSRNPKMNEEKMKLQE